MTEDVPDHILHPRTYRDKTERVPFLLRTLNDEKRCEIVRQSVNQLIESLYEPDADMGWVCRPGNPFSHDAINWGDLSCPEVELLGTRFIVYIEEAAPDAYDFAAWVKGWLNKWGWDDVDVRTEW